MIMNGDHQAGSPGLVCSLGLTLIFGWFAQVTNNSSADFGDGDGRSIFDIAGEERAPDTCLHLVSQEAAKRAGTADRVGSLVSDVMAGRRGELKLELSVSQSTAELVDEDVDDFSISTKSSGLNITTSSSRLRTSGRRGPRPYGLRRTASVSWSPSS